MILHVVNSLEGGGTERTLVALLRAFNPAFHRHAVVTLRAAGSLSALLPDHAACRPLAIQGRSRRAGFTLAGVVRQFRAAMIHARNTGCWHDAIVAKLLTPGVRLVLGFHGLETVLPFSPPQRRWTRAALLAGARFTSVSEAARRQLHEQAKVPLNRIDLLRNGVDLRRFRPWDETARRRAREEQQLGDAAFVVGTVGSLTPVKQHALLVQAVARMAESHPNLRLLIVGDGPLRRPLTRQAQREGVADRVRITGWRNDVTGLLACMDTYVCSSASEGMSNALLEAMGAGLPIIATDVGDNARIVRNDVEGWIVPPDSPAALACALRRLADHPEVRAGMASAARQRAEAYDFQDVVREYESYYRRMLPANFALKHIEPASEKKS